MKRTYIYEAGLGSNYLKIIILIMFCIIGFQGKIILNKDYLSVRLLIFSHSMWSCGLKHNALGFCHKMRSSVRGGFWPVYGINPVQHVIDLACHIFSDDFELGYHHIDPMLP